MSIIRKYNNHNHNAYKVKSGWSIVYIDGLGLWGLTGQNELQLEMRLEIL